MTGVRAKRSSAMLARSAATFAAAAALAACTVGPDYRAPQTDAPAAWRVDPADSFWRVAQPAHAPLDPQWWKVFGDADLDGLEQAALADNQTLRVAAAHYEQARATLASVSSAQAPQVSLDASAARERVSANRPQLSYATPNMSTVQNDLAIGPTVSYELDLFGRIRRTVESAQASAQQAGDDLANARLVLTAELATDYYALRELDNEIDVVNRSVDLQQKALDFVNAQHDLGAVSGLNVLQQKAQLDATRTQVHLLVNQRAQYEHAIATLTGQAAPEFALAPKVGPLPVPVLPPGVPSELLQRRPDVASAERAMAAANAQIGVARAAYFPDLTLSPTLGWESTRFSTLFSVPSLVWSLGGAAGEMLFDGGKREAGVAFAKAGYESAQASYRQTVLTAFQEVQNAVTGLSVLAGASADAQAAVDDARKSFDLANDRYQGGLVAFIDVINAQQQLLASERQQVQIHGQQAATVVFLAKALGGGWSANEDALARGGAVGAAQRGDSGRTGAVAAAGNG
ncbi:NodT family efflux transporter outer membrane factor (OMF) lipoprotein [Paraburkholderia caballeronis]|nr:NodT family efflux transporter outer membrane factor (OMF) lipoprotein [Paraburkholderia caballeronis]TDV11235.1 NodT family efflux transporter outer membrane factor (OMF) lipoprotein [Paraburkholderia caballeronis]TDV21615.1 NodT family efflux transporter outer membrane factor (OMF) lipoprotein [Paraburkholderia caballeronis]